jgi:ribosomal protein L37AE/L43A
MAMTKYGTSFDNSIVEVVDGAQTCEKCKAPLNLLESKEGLVSCQSCGFENKIVDMKAE